MLDDCRFVSYSEKNNGIKKYIFRNELDNVIVLHTNYENCKYILEEDGDVYNEEGKRKKVYARQEITLTAENILFYHYPR